MGTRLVGVLNCSEPRTKIDGLTSLVLDRTFSWVPTGQFDCSPTMGFTQGSTFTYTTSLFTGVPGVKSVEVLRFRWGKRRWNGLEWQRERERGRVTHRTSRISSVVESTRKKKLRQDARDGETYQVVPDLPRCRRHTSKKTPHTPDPDDFDRVPRSRRNRGHRSRGERGGRKKIEMLVMTPTSRYYGTYRRKTIVEDPKPK